MSCLRTYRSKSAWSKFGGLTGIGLFCSSYLIACGASTSRDSSQLDSDEVKDDGNQDSGTTSSGGESSSVDSSEGDSDVSNTVDPGDDDSNEIELPKFDLQVVPDFEIPEVKDGCGKVDFIFIIDNSPSMLDEQENLARSVPEFLTAISDATGVNDFNILVSDTDTHKIPGGMFSCLGETCSCSPAPTCCEEICGGGIDQCNSALCDSYPPGTCDGQLGSGKNTDSNGQSCNFDGGRRYMTINDTNLVEAFGCAGRVGINGMPTETQAYSLVNSVSPEQLGAGGCNEGFLRDDALLVATLITDEEDLGKSPGSPQDWYDAIVTAKNGDPAAAVVIGIVGDGDVAGSVCAGSNNQAEPSPNLRKFVELFGKNGQTVSICSPDYTQEFKDIVAVINAACEDFIPPK